MKMFKRFAAALLAGVMVLAMLTACGGNGGGGASLGEQLENAMVDQMNNVRSEGSEKLTNDPTLRAQALAVLNKATADGKLKQVDITKNVLVMAEKGGPDEEGYYTLLAMTEENLANLKRPQQPNAKYDAITAFGVATRVVNGKTYLAFAMTDSTQGQN